MTKLTCKPRARAVAIGLLLAGALPALAQQEPAEPPKRIRIEVTGTNIPRIDGESGLPLQTITREDLINGGVQTAQDLLERISANQSFGSFNEAKGLANVPAGFTAASLRGLGYQRTLVLLDGKRLAPYALSGGQSVDLSGIPVSALERVEILKDGASAIYGTDAIGGVINFILRKDFRGVEMNVNYFATEHGGGNNGRINVTAGAGDLVKDKYNLFVSADHFKQESLKASQRESTRTGYIPSLGVDRTAGNSIPANINQPGGFTGTFNPTIPPSGATPSSCLPPFSFPTFRTPLQCRFDIPTAVETIPEAEKTNVIGRFTWQIDPDHQVFAEGSWYDGKFIQRISPAVVSDQVTNTPMTLPPTSPYYPAVYIATLPGGRVDLPIHVRYRTLELGPRTVETKVDQWRGIVGLQGTVKGWDYQLSASYTANREIDDYTSGWLSESAFGPLLRSGVINPFGFNTGAVLEQMRATQAKGQADDNRASHYAGDFKLTNTIVELPAGPVALALGLEARRESLEQMNSDFVVSGDIIGFLSGVPSLPPTHRTVWSMFGEINIPIVKPLELNLAARYDHYGDFGGTTNPKLTLRWQPAREVLVRAAFGTGFRAPTLTDLFQPSVDLGFDPHLDDPIRCPVTHSDNDCNTDFPARGGGNPLLQPEKSRQVNAGLVVEPMNGLSASVDYYWVKVTNLFGGLPGDAILADYARWAPTHVVRKPPDAQFPNLPGEIAYLIENQVNFGTLQTSGIDIDVRWRPPATSIGQFTLGLTGTYVIGYQVTGLSTALFPSAVGTRGPDGAISRWRHYATLNWTYGSWGATLAQTFQDGYSEVDLLTCDSSFQNCPGNRRVGSYSVWDVQARYTGFKDLTLTLGIRNLLDTPPPISNQGNNFQIGIDPTYADPRGRIYYAAIRCAFR